MRPTHRPSRHRLHPAFVATVSTLSFASACSTKTGVSEPVGDGATAQPTGDRPPADPPEPIHANPPGMPAVEVSDDPEAFHVRVPEARIEWSTYPREVNARTEEHKMIYRAREGCFIHGELPEAPRSWVPPPREEVACPPIMRAPHWSHCVGGTLRANEAGDTCLCSRDGNPPPPPHLQDCPPG